MNSLPDNERAYFAGHFDGEGYICASKSLYVAVTHSHLPTLMQYRDKFGGSILQEPLRKGQNKQLWRWHVTSKIGVARFLLNIEPFLIEKKAQAQLTLSYLSKSVDRRCAGSMRDELHEKLKLVRSAQDFG